MASGNKITGNGNTILGNDINLIGHGNSITGSNINLVNTHGVTILSGANITAFNVSGGSLNTNNSTYVTNLTVLSSVTINNVTYGPSGATLGDSFWTNGNGYGSITTVTPNVLTGTNLTNGAFSYALGSGNTSSGDLSIAIGRNNLISSALTMATGEQVESYNHNEFVRGSGMEYNQTGGLAQFGMVGCGVKTTNATPTKLFLNYDPITLTGTSNFNLTRNNTVYYVNIRIIGVIGSLNAFSGDTVTFEADGVIKNKLSTVSLLGGGFTQTKTFFDGSLSGTTLAIQADVAEQSLDIVVAGRAATVMNWFGHITYQAVNM